MSKKNRRFRSSRKNKDTKLTFNFKLRLILVWLFLFVGVIGLGWRLFYLQITEAADLQKKATQQQMLNLSPYIPRRTILDSQNNAVAVDKIKYELYAHPSILKEDKTELAQKLSKILVRYTPTEILIKLKEKPTGVILDKKLNEEEAEKIKAIQSDGLEVIKYYTRFYPHDQLMADVVGYVGYTDNDNQRKGLAGIEFGQEELLRRDLDMIQVKRAGNGAIIPLNVPEELIEFDDLQLQLTIDSRLQRAAREALKKQLKKFNAKRGAVIVMSVDDGAIVTMVCEPTYNPNEYFKYTSNLFKNWTITDTYEPGSTFKPLNVAIALEEGVINANSHVNDSGSVVIDGWPISNASGFGKGSISITQVLESSSNIGMIRIMEKVNRQKYYQYLKEIGLGQITGVDLPFEASGYMKSKNVFTARAIEPAVTSFGQGFSLTPLQLVQLHASLANGGKLVTPHVIAGVVDSQGKLKQISEAKEKKIFSPTNTDKVIRMMESVVKNGTGKAAYIEGYRIGGKTGTAQKTREGGRGYLLNAKITSFVSILPINSPRYVVFAVVDEPQGENTFGSTVAAPIVKEVIESLISLKGLPPS